MKAVRVSQFGGPDVLTVDDIAVPEPGRGEVLVQTQAAGVGVWDAKMRSGMFGPQTFPFIPGAELSGVVAGIGERVSGVEVGDPVIALPGMSGCYAEYAVVPVDRMAPAPRSVNPILAAGLPVCGVTAMQAIAEHLQVGRGETVLITGAAGGVGSLAVQLAVSRGARVIGTASPGNHGYLERLGASVAIDYGEPDWADAVRKEAGGGVDALLDCVGGTTFLDSLEAVGDGGRAVTIVGRQDEPQPGRGITWSSFLAEGTTARLAEAARLVDQGVLAIDVTRTFRLGKAAEAHSVVETHHTRGKVVLIVDPSIE